MTRYFKDGEPDWQRIEAAARRNWRRFAHMANEDLSAWGGGMRIGRMLASGDMRLVALYLIEQQSRHGYDLIKAVEEQSGGVYSPSPGVVYPALTYLEEAGFVTSAVEGNKKLYAITEEGRAHLDENRASIEATLGFLSRAGEQMQRFRDFTRAERPFGGEPGPEPDGAAAEPPPAGDARGPHRRGHSHGGRRPVWPFGEEAPDRPLGDVLPEVDEARRELKAAIRKARKQGAEHQHRLAEIMRKAAADIRAIGPEDDDVDI